MSSTSFSGDMSFLQDVPPISKILKDLDEKNERDRREKDDGDVDQALESLKDRVRKELTASKSGLLSVCNGVDSSSTPIEDHAELAEAVRQRDEEKARLAAVTKELDGLMEKKLFLTKKVGEMEAKMENRGE